MSKSLIKRPKLRNEARLTFSISFDDVKNMVENVYDSIKVIRSDKTIVIEGKDFSKLKLTPMDGNWFVANYSELI